MDELGQLRQVIEQWNQNRLDLFELSMPNEDLEFHGVMRFYFQDAGQKVATKCIRVSSTATAHDVINTLIEKFRPDIRMLSVPEYAIYEIHENGGERMLADEEQPLLVQLNWHKDDREGRFLLRRMDETTYLPGFAPEQSHFKRKLSKREKKEMKKLEKKKAKEAKENNDNSNKQSSSQGTGKDGIAEKLYTEIPETSFTRSISNPEAVMRRRRQQKLEKKLQQLCQEGGPEAGGTLRIFGETLNPDVPYKTLLLSTRDTACAVVREILEKYGRDREESGKYCLVQLIHSIPHSIPHTGVSDVNPVHDLNGNPGIREYILDDDDCPLAIERQHNSRTRGSLSFHIRQRPADYQPRKKKKQGNLHRGDLMDRLQFVQDNRPELVNELTQGEGGRGVFVNGSERSASTNSQSNSQYCPSEEVAPVPPSPTVDTSNQPSVGTFDTNENQVQRNGAVNPVPRPASQSSQHLYQYERGVSTLGPTTSLPQPLVRSQSSQQQVAPLVRSQSSQQQVAPLVRSQSSQQQMVPSIPGPEVQVYLMHKGDGGMGLSIVATKGLNQDKSGIYIKSVVPGGAADRDGRLEAGDQIIKINGTELLGVSQVEAAELIKETGSEVTLEVGKNAAAFHGLGGIFTNPNSPMVSRGGVQHHSQSQSLLPQNQIQSQSLLPQNQIQSQSLLPQNQIHPPQFRQPPHLVPGMGLHSLMQQSVTSAPQLQSHLSSSMIQEERHYQNIGMYRQPPNGLPSNGLPSNGLPSNGVVRTGPNGQFLGPVSDGRTLPQGHHTSYASLHQVTPNQQQPIATQAPNGRPLSTVYTHGGNTHGGNMMNQQQRVTSMAQYPTTGATHPGQGPLFRTPHSGSVPALHHWRGNPDNFPPSHMIYSSNGTGPHHHHHHHPSHQPVFMRPPTHLPPGTNTTGRIVMKPVEQEPIPAVSYRFGPSGYPSSSSSASASTLSKANDSLNNNVLITSNAINSNNPAMNSSTSSIITSNHHNSNNNYSIINNNQWPRRTKHASAQDILLSSQIDEQSERLRLLRFDDEQSERLRLLRFEELKRKQHELEAAQLAEDRLLHEAKTRHRQDDEPRMQQLRSQSSVKHPHHDFGQNPREMDEGGSDVPPPLPKSPPPLDDDVNPGNKMHQQQQRIFSNHMIDEYSKQSSASRGEMNGTSSSSLPSSSSSLPNGPAAKKAVSWNDSTIPTSMNETNSCSILSNGSATSSGFTLQDIDEVLGSTTAEASTLLPNTPNVIGSQEVYRDPRERIREEKMKTQAPRAVQGPEKLSFKEKMKMFAMTEAANATANERSASRVKNDGENDGYTLQEVSEQVATN